MTALYDPHADWARDDRDEHAVLSAMQPVLGPLVDGDLCDITVRRGGRLAHCHAEAVREATDADGRTRLLCAAHVAKYFPFHNAVS